MPTSRKSKKPKLIIIVGPTASGKSELAIKIATWVQQHGERAEIISADSRQVYKGLDIGTGKVPGAWKLPRKKSHSSPHARILENTSMRRKEFFHKGVRHHLIDIVSPKRRYTVAQYQNTGRKIVSTLLDHGSTPIICGGTGLYVNALLSDQKFPEVKPDLRLRKKLEKISAENLFIQLRTIDPRRAKTIDRHNKRRLVRALEIATMTDCPVPPFPAQHPNILENVGMLKIGIVVPREKLRSHINRRVDKMFKRGLVREVKNLVKKYGAACPAFDAIGYREIISYVQGKMTLQEARALIKRNTWHYAKRQMTWFRRDKEIMWITKSPEGMRLVKKFLSSLRTQ